MFSFLRKNLIGELVILVVESDYNEKFNMHSHILLSSPTKIKVGELKTRISGVTSIPPERILLLFCGQILTIERDYIPEESFEPCNVVDEDNLSFRPRLCLRIMDDPTVHIEEEEPDADRRRIGSNDDTNKPQAKQRHKHKHKGKNEFDLERELSGEVNCVPFASLLRKQGYDNEVQFSVNMNLIKTQLYYYMIICTVYFVPCRGRCTVGGVRKSLDRCTARTGLVDPDGSCASHPLCMPASKEETSTERQRGSQAPLPARGGEWSGFPTLRGWAQ